MNPGSISPTQARELLPRVVAKLEDPIGGQDADGEAFDSTVGDRVLIDHRTPEQAMKETELRDKINRALGMLRERERFILLHHVAWETKTLEEIGEAFGGMCRERVRQIELTAKAKFHWWMNRLLGGQEEEPRVQCTRCHKWKRYTAFSHIEGVKVYCGACEAKMNEFREEMEYGNNE